MIGPTRENVINITCTRVEARENWETPLGVCDCLFISCTADSKQVLNKAYMLRRLVFRKMDCESIHWIERGIIMKQFAALFAATALVGVTTAFAANPFSDVTSDSWAYQSVAQLANAGIINGYPDGTFKGQNNITRYEMAQMVAKAMANQDKANAEQQAMINRLADEFSSELNNLGVRVSNLEDRVGNIKATGDVRLRYVGNNKNNGHYDAYDKHSKFDMRGRVQFNAKVNDKTSAVIRLTSDDMEFGDATGNKSGQARFDQVYVAHQFGKKATLIGGRFPLTVGAGLAYDDNFDGVGAILTDSKHVTGVVGYGSMVEGLVRDAGLDAEKNARVSLAQVTAGNLAKGQTVGAYYLGVADHFNTSVQALNDLKAVYGFNANYNYNKIWVGGEWIKGKYDHNAAKDLGSSAWVAGIGYGNYDQSKKGTWDVKAQYFNQKALAPIVSSTWNQAYDLGSTLAGKNGYKGWMATVDYTLAKNVGLSAYYGFDSKDQKGHNLSDFYRAELNYKF